ncbi:MAG: large conductance mechanosensitive channel protein MscL [Actinobacteria bacterium]|nr:MAG: large conductance mechanosensitive channel protein MscL [Actinomycetota bacterium]
MFKEFKEFAFRGNVIDLSVAVVMGAAFGGIVTSFVANVINPLVGLLMGGTDLNNLFWVLRDGTAAGPYASLDAAQKAGAAVLGYGAFFNAIVSFLLIALALFLVVKAVNRFRAKEELTTRECPFCTTEISKAATRCPACTSEVAPEA